MNANRVTFKKNHHFDQRFFPFLQVPIDACQPIISTDKVLQYRLRAMQKTRSYPWDFDQVFMSDVLMLKCMDKLDYPVKPSSVLLKRDGSATAHKIIQLHSVFTTILPIVLNKTIVYMPHLHKDEELLARKLSDIPHFPNWSITLNLVGHGLKFNDKDLAGVTFIKTIKNYVMDERFSKDKVAEQSLTMYMITAEAMCYHVDTLSLDSGLTLEQAAINAVENMTHDDYVPKHMTALPVPKRVVDQCVDTACQLFSYLYYVIDNQDKLKDKDGNSASFAPNPSIYLEDNEVKISGLEEPLILHLD